MSKKTNKKKNALTQEQKEQRKAARIECTVKVLATLGATFATACVAALGKNLVDDAFAIRHK